MNLDNSEVKTAYYALAVAYVKTMGQLKRAQNAGKSKPGVVASLAMTAADQEKLLNRLREEVGIQKRNQEVKESK